MPTFESAVDIRCEPHEAFEFLVRPANVVRVSPEAAGLRLVDAPERLELGSRVEFEVAAFGPAQRLVHEIVAFEEPTRFTERQIKGPLKSFMHEHRIELLSDGMTRVIDAIAFEPPGGLVGFLVTAERILESLRIGFEHRHREMKALLEGAGA
ncbi:MAG: SRPBCC family protein [Planctomycetaceae bacterium]